MFAPDLWNPDPREIRLAEEEIHVWRARLDCGELLVSEFRSTLASDEEARANRYFSISDRNHFVVARGVLRDLLGRYVGCAPREIQFEYAPHGKPSLCPEFLRLPIRFNVSHSHGLALFAFSLGRDVGVDVELVRSDFGGSVIAERYFARQEVQELRALPTALQAEGFFLCWTRKEAYLKARGEGLQIPLKSFCVSLTPGLPARLHSADTARWSLRSLRPDQQYVGALVAGGHGWSLRCRDWSLWKAEDRKDPKDLRKSTAELS
jgi:4'-phosphopantetheinyl transferase